MMGHPVLLLAAVLLLLVSSGCSMAASSQPSPPPGAAEENLVRFSGRVVHVPLEGGFFALVSDDGRRFDPVRLPPPFQQDGLRVRVTGRLAEPSAGIHMWGSRLEILTIDKE